MNRPITSKEIDSVIKKTCEQRKALQPIASVVNSTRHLKTPNFSKKEKKMKKETLLTYSMKLALL